MFSAGTGAPWQTPPAQALAHSGWGSNSRSVLAQRALPWALPALEPQVVELQPPVGQRSVHVAWAQVRTPPAPSASLAKTGLAGSAGRLEKHQDCLSPFVEFGWTGRGCENPSRSLAPLEGCSKIYTIHHALTNKGWNSVPKVDRFNQKCLERLHMLHCASKHVRRRITALLAPKKGGQPFLSSDTPAHFAHLKPCFLPMSAWTCGVGFVSAKQPQARMLIVHPPRVLVFISRLISTVITKAVHVFAAFKCLIQPVVIVGVTRSAKITRTFRNA